LSKGRP